MNAVLDVRLHLLNKGMHRWGLPNARWKSKRRSQVLKINPFYNEFHLWNPQEAIGLEIKKGHFHKHESS